VARMCTYTASPLQVYKAELASSGPVAVKVLRKHSVDVARLLREAEIMHSCRHPSILEVSHFQTALEDAVPSPGSLEAPAARAAVTLALDGRLLACPTETADP